MKAHNQSHFNNLRATYSSFIFEDLKIQMFEKELIITYYFSISNQFFFQPQIKIPFNSNFKKEILSGIQIKQMAFQIGMVELISYWKATCSPKVIIKPYYLNDNQSKFWKKIYFNGLGEFFYLNSIHTDINLFMNFEFSIDSEPIDKFKLELDDSYLIPVGGGKDSVVTMELFQQNFENNLCLIINPRGASLNTALNAGFKSNQIIEIQRTIAPQLLELNAKGFLNGHTPFSALLAFVSLLIAALTGKKNIALSNESSANEATVDGSNINHQYSKSFEFEKDFRAYVFGYIAEDFNYFSFLRPLSEYQIAKLFSVFKHQHQSFRSCNVGSKTDVWCCNCPKCLFTFIMLSSFLAKDDLINIFGEDLYENKNLKFYFDQLIGMEEIKPFECVGTIEEVNSALCITLNKFYSDNKNLPFLLKYYLSTESYQKYRMVDENSLLKHYNNEHFLNESCLNILYRTL